MRCKLKEMTDKIKKNITNKDCLIRLYKIIIIFFYKFHSSAISALPLEAEIRIAFVAERRMAGIEMRQDDVIMGKQIEHNGEEDVRRNTTVTNEVTVFKSFIPRTPSVCIIILHLKDMYQTVKVRPRL